MPQLEKKTGPSYRIGELSQITGVKAGTIRFYEKCGFVGPVGRSANNYRIYDERHIFQVRVCRLVFGGFVNRRLRRESLKVLDAATRWDMAAYAETAADYQRAVEEDIDRTEKAIAICMEQMERETTKERCYSKKEAAALTGTTPEAIRNWERNGLLGVFEPYQKRLYGQALINRMYVIRLLLDTGYSMMAIRSFMQEYTSGRTGEARILLLEPGEDEELRYRSDRYLEALHGLRERALQLRMMAPFSKVIY
ncbi:MAG: MerR family transcriptional regulator [bacterium]|nr:MerR family transcriptional regulator [bacterium]MCM1375100.1 MerR family transcriptional regulator [Muribaculum sp.]